MNAFIKREYDYAVRICVYLAGKPLGISISISHISKILSITKPFTNKIINQLRLKGVTGSIQGKYGGVFLKKDPNRLSILDVLKAMNFNSTLNECIRNYEICPLIGDCNIHIFFKEQENLLLNIFDEKKITDFVFKEPDLLNNPKASQTIT